MNRKKKNRNPARKRNQLVMMKSWMTTKMRRLHQKMKNLKRTREAIKYFLTIQTPFLAIFVSLLYCLHSHVVFSVIIIDSMLYFSYLSLFTFLYENHRFPQIFASKHVVFVE